MHCILNSNNFIEDVIDSVTSGAHTLKVKNSNIWPFWYRDRNIPEQINQYHDLWCPGLRRFEIMNKAWQWQRWKHNIITCDANSAYWTEIWEFSKSQRDIIDTVIITINVFDIICYVDYYSAAKFKLRILQPSNMVVSGHLENRK